MPYIRLCKTVRRVWDWGWTHHCDLKHSFIAGLKTFKIRASRPNRNRPIEYSPGTVYIQYNYYTYCTRTRILRHVFFNRETFVERLQVFFLHRKWHISPIKYVHVFCNFFIFLTRTDSVQKVCGLRVSTSQHTNNIIVKTCVTLLSKCFTVCLQRKKLRETSVEILYYISHHEVPQRPLDRSKCFCTWGHALRLQIWNVQKKNI